MTNADRIIAALLTAAATATPRPRHTLPPGRWVFGRNGRRQFVGVHGPVTPLDPLVVTHATGMLTVHRSVPNLVQWAERVHATRDVWDGEPPRRKVAPRFPWPREHVEPDPS